MKIILEKSKYLSLFAIFSLLLTFALSLFWGIVQAFKAWEKIVLSGGQAPDVIIYLLKLVDAFLVAMVIYILAASLYELFIGQVNLPGKLVAGSLSELKGKLSSLIVLVLVVYAVEVVFREEVNGLDLLWRVIAIVLLVIVLIAFSYFGGSQGQSEN